MVALELCLWGQQGAVAWISCPLIARAKKKVLLLRSEACGKRVGPLLCVHGQC